MTGRTLVVVVTVLLTASTLLAMAPALAHATPTPRGTSPPRTDVAGPAAAIVAETLNGFGEFTVSFYPGAPGAGTLNFEIRDPLDKDVNVTLTDPNASRDGVPNPAFYYEAVLNSSSEFNSYQSHVSYVFPATLPYGGHWQITFSAPNGGTLQENLMLHLYSVDLSSSIGSGATIPGAPVTLFWSLVDDSNDATLYTRATNVTLTGQYTGNATLQNLFTKKIALPDAAAGNGSWQGMIPLNSTPGTVVRFEVYAQTNVSGSIAENESNNLTVEVGTLTIRSAILTTAPPSCTAANQVLFENGSLVGACVVAGVNWRATFTPIAGLPVDVSYWNGTTHVTAGATSLVTNASGEAAFVFVASSPPFTPETRYPRTNAVNFTVSVPGATGPYAWTVYANLTWTLLVATTADGTVKVTLNHSDYYVGATATASWWIRSTNLTKTGPINPTEWAVTGSDGATYASSAITGTAQNGTFTFAVTSAMARSTIEVWVFAANATTLFSGETVTSVIVPSLLLTPSSLYYTAGSSVSVTTVENGGGVTGPIAYEVEGTWGSGWILMTSGSVANGSAFVVQIPPTAPPTSVLVEAWATNSAGQIVTSGEATLDLAQGYSVLLGVSSVSSYSDGSFQPGQTVTLSYQLASVGGAPLPQTTSFILYVLGYPDMFLLENVAASGSFSFTIPSDAVQGTMVLSLEAESIAPASCVPDDSCVGIASLHINPNPSFLNWELGAGSGVTVGWLIVLALVIVLPALLWLRFRRGGGRRPSSSTKATAPAAEWQEPTPPSAGSGTGNPPSPPSGAP